MKALQGFTAVGVLTLAIAGGVVGGVLAATPNQTPPTVGVERTTTTEEVEPTPMPTPARTPDPDRDNETPAPDAAIRYGSLVGGVGAPPETRRRPAPRVEPSPVDVTSGPVAAESPAPATPAVEQAPEPAVTPAPKPECEEGERVVQPWHTRRDGSRVGGGVSTCVDGKMVVTTPEREIPTPTPTPAPVNQNCPHADEAKCVGWMPDEGAAE